MPENVFSQFKNGQTIAVGGGRKVFHAVKDRVYAGVGGYDAAGAGLDTAGHVTGGASIAVLAGATGAVAMAMTGPIGGSVLAILAMAKLAIDTYSDREKAHAELTPFVWSFIDDRAPKKFLEVNEEQMIKVGAATLSLIERGKSQLTRMQAKSAAAERTFNALLSAFERTRTPTERLSLYERECQPGGAIFEYMRRLVHMANYLQAFTIYEKIMRADKSALEDFALKMPSVGKARQTLSTLSNQIIAARASSILPPRPAAANAAAPGAPPPLLARNGAAHGGHGVGAPPLPPRPGATAVQGSKNRPPLPPRNVVPPPMARTPPGVKIVAPPPPPMRGRA